VDRRQNNRNTEKRDEYDMRCCTNGSFILYCSSHPHPFLKEPRKEVQRKVSTLRFLLRRPSTALYMWDHYTNELKVPENVPRL